MKIEITTEDAPKAIGPYSQAVSAGGFIFISGQIPIDPKEGTVITGDIEEQTRVVLKNIQNILRKSGKGMDSIIRTTVYLKDMSCFSAMNSVYAEFFSAPYPSRVTVGVNDLPGGVGIEIAAVAI